MKNILLIDDEQDMLDSLHKLLSRNSEYKISMEQDAQKALDRVGKTKYDLIITDLKMKNVSGMEILRKALGTFPDSIVIVISGYGTIDTSVEAMREGAFDFIEKPFTSKKLYEIIEHAFSQNYKKTEKLEDSSKGKDAFSGIVYQSEQIEDLIRVVKRISPGNMNVLVTGESGTGKELFARAIHSLSKRNLNPFVPVNCGALPENLFESELFGHERGAFTGAIKTKPGLLEFANHGTFFLDEIGDLSLAMQIKLLRMLEERKIRRVGGQQEIDIDVRIIAATNKDLNKAVHDKQFREDLYYRLNAMEIKILPLRERPDDIIPLAKNFLTEHCCQNDQSMVRLSSDAEKALKNYTWPGNVRELQNIISRAFYLCSNSIIQKADLPISKEKENAIFDDDIINLSYKNAKENLMEKFEVEYLTHHIKRNNGNISRTAELCGLDRRSIHRLINKYNIIYEE
ncbi:MAG: sigma-54-dependent Fis family transcriptional regulator [Calditrichaeota bacterium]|nr:MAG: sigma-54-dependent Fis family transcriptional regulator [Calditrichota bacterium]MBL1206243.1 sigma-54-dependent Fis family transcriptional regulator [Calditrichota bacterium]NOG46069.1 sigma-54-dependent Fis family transcriptional regulator [Calditrichota bacterium]